MKGTRARSWGGRVDRPVPEEREVPKSWVKRGVSWGERMVNVYDIVGCGGVNRVALRREIWYGLVVNKVGEVGG